MDLSIVIPAYNEEQNVVPLYERITSVLDSHAFSYEIIFVDDGSTDRTFESLLKLKSNRDKVKIVKFRKNYGQTAALDAAFTTAKGEIIISMDADLQNDPADIPRLIEQINQGYDVVCGWRMERKDPLMKKLISRGAYLLRKIIIQDQIHDSGCTLRAYRKKCVQHLRLYGEMHRFIPALLIWEGFRITEISVNHDPRRYGHSKYRLNRVVKGWLDMLVVKFWMKYSSRPIHLFGGMGLFMALVGFGFGVYLSVIKLFYGFSIGNRPLLLLSVLLMILGVQFIIFGVLGDILIKIYYGENRKSYFIEEIIQ